MQVTSSEKRHSMDIWGEFLNPAVIFWALVWALLIDKALKAPKSVKGQWRSLTPSRQYVLMSVLFISAITVGMGLLSWVLSRYVDYVMAGMLVGFPFFSLHLLKDEEGMTLWSKITHKLLVVPFLWRDNVTRTCKKCGYHDYTTRDLGIKSGPRSAYEPCESCGSTNFEFRKLE